MMPRTKDFQRLWPTIAKLTWCCLEIGDAPPKLWLFLCLSIRPPKRARTRIDTHIIACGGPKSDTQPATHAQGVLPAKLLFERGRGLTIQSPSERQSGNGNCNPYKIYSGNAVHHVPSCRAVWNKPSLSLSGSRHLPNFSATWHRQQSCPNA